MDNAAKRILLSSYISMRRIQLVLSLTVMRIHQVLVCIIWRSAARTIIGEQTSCELTLAHRSSLNGFTRVYRSVIVCSNNFLVERVDAPGRRTYQTRRSSHLPIYFQAVEQPPAPKSAPTLRRNQCLVEAVDERHMALGEEKSLGLIGETKSR